MQMSGRTLAIETASEACSVALFEEGKLLARDHRVLGRGHAEQLIPMIKALPENGRSSRILVSLGPGSFTGVRIGIAAARALGFAWSAQVLGYPTLALVAACAIQEHGAPVTVCMNGGHGEWFIQNFSDGRTADSVRSLTPEMATKAGCQRVVAGNRASEFAAMLDDQPLALDLLPDATMLCFLDESWLTEDLAPIYGRGPDAVPQKVRSA